jgi:outer membrane autotransporter protein
MTPNQRSVGNVLEPGYSVGLTGGQATFYANLLSAQSLGILEQLSGEGTAAAQNAAFAGGSLFNGTMFTQGMSGGFGNAGLGLGGPLAYAAPARKRTTAFASIDAQQQESYDGRWRPWVAGFGNSRSIDGQAAAGTAGQSQQTGGGAFGANRLLAPDLLVGFAVGGSASRFSVPDRATSGELAGGHVGAIAVKTAGAFYAAGALSYAHFDNSTSRTIVGAGPTEFAKGNFGSDQFSARGELGWRLPRDGYAVTPFIAIEPGALWQRGFTESSTLATGGAGTLALTYQPRTTTSLPTFVGAQVDTQMRLANGGIAHPYARVSWVHEFIPERRVDAAFVTIPGLAFTVDGARPASDAVRLDAGARIALERGLSAFGNLSGEFSDRARSYTASAGVRSVW